MTEELSVRTLLELLDRLPVGISASTPEGEPLYVNSAGRRHASLADNDEGPVGDRTVRVDHMSLLGEGSPHEVRLSFDVTEQRKLEDDLFRRAYFDNLTALPNRSLVEQSAATLVDHNADAKFALAFIDLDGFKNINDYYGHGVGDTLLVKIAERLSRELGPSDMLARLGGDEFLLLLSSAESREEIAASAERFLGRLNEPFFIDGHEILTSASIGISTYPADGRSFDTLCENADRAMYRVKGSAKGAIHFFDPSVEHSVGERMKLEQRLRLAIRDRRLTCAYQPKMDFRAGEVVGLEVLLRWRDEEGVIHPPGDFVNLAVELGLMDEITHLVLAETITNIDRINEAFGAEVTISINVAAKQADDPVFMRTLVDALSNTGYPQRFMIEVTEEAFFEKNRFQVEVLPMLRAIGTSVSIDDFGVGYSSLSALADVTADEIKVDRSFITDIHKRPRSQSVLKAIESLAQALGMSIIVEGVESQDELLYLQAATTIRLAQGYYFSRAMVIDEFTQTRTATHDLREAAEPTRLRAAGRA